MLKETSLSVVSDLRFQFPRPSPTLLALAPGARWAVSGHTLGKCCSPEAKKQCLRTFKVLNRPAAGPSAEVTLALGLQWEFGQVSVERVELCPPKGKYLQATIKKPENKREPGCGEMGILVYCWPEYKNGTSATENNTKVLQKLKLE